MKRVTPKRLMTVGEVIDHLATFDRDDPVVVESSFIYPDSYDGKRIGAEADDLDLHRVVGFYNSKDTPLATEGAVLCILRNVSIQKVYDNSTDTDEIVEDVRD